jgi:hypothetical protein
MCRKIRRKISRKMRRKTRRKVHKNEPPPSDRRHHSQALNPSLRPARLPPSTCKYDPTPVNPAGESPLRLSPQSLGEFRPSSALRPPRTNPSGLPAGLRNRLDPPSGRGKAMALSCGLCRTRGKSPEREGEPAGERAGARGRGVAGSLRCRRIFSITGGSEMKATTTMGTMVLAEEQREQASESR